MWHKAAVTEPSSLLLPPPGVSGAQAVHRAVAIVRTVARRQRSGATLARIARDTGMSRSTAFRLLRALTVERLLSFGEGGCYRIGPLAYELGLAAPPERQPRDEWREAVAQVARLTGLTGYLIARSGDEAVCLLCVQGAAAIRAMPVEVGQRVRLGFGAGSLAILASLDDREVERIAASLGSAMTADELRARVARTRRDGHAVSSGTVARGVSGVGVAVPGDGSGASLALTVSAVTPSMSAREAATLAGHLARAIRWQAAQAGRPAGEGIDGGAA